MSARRSRQASTRPALRRLAAAVLCLGCTGLHALTITLNPGNYNQGFQPLADAGLTATSSSALSGNGQLTPLYSAVTYGYEFARLAAVYLPGAGEPMLDVAAAMQMSIVANPLGQTPRYARSADASAQVLQFLLQVDDSQVASGTPVALDLRYRSFTEVVGAGNASVSFVLRRLWGGQVVGQTLVQISDYVRPASVDDSGAVVPGTAGTDRLGSIGAYGDGGAWSESAFSPADGGQLRVAARAGEQLSLSLYANASAVAAYDGRVGVAVGQAEASALLDPYLRVATSDPNAGVVRILNALTGTEYQPMDWGSHLPQLAPVPEPATGALWLGAAALLLARRTLGRSSGG